MIFKNFPIYQQLDQMDCGPTCLRMISKYYGRSFSLEDLRRRSFISREGVSLYGLSKAAESIGFSTVGTKITIDQLETIIPLPCIVHWSQNHFVVIYKISKGRIYVADPAGLKIKYKRDEFLKEWLPDEESQQKQGVVLILEPTQKFFETETGGKNTEELGIRYLFNFLKSFKTTLLQLVLGLLLASIIQFTFPFLTQILIDVGINTRDISFVQLVIAAQVALFFGKASIDLMRRWLLLHLSTRVNIYIISDFLSKLLRLPVSFFDTKLTGDLLQRIDDHSKIERFFSSSSLNILFSLFGLIVFGVVLSMYSLVIFSVFAIGSATYMIYILLFLKKRRELDYRQFHQLADQQSNLIQLISGMPEIKLNNCEEKKRLEWEAIQVQLFRINIERTKLIQIQEIGGQVINEAKNIVITLITVTSVMNGEMTLGMMLAVQFIIGQLNAPVNEFINFTRDMQDARISLERIGEIHSIEDEDNYNRVVESTGYEVGTISIQNVSFQYEGPESAKVLENVNCQIPHGKITAIVGSSGSGKTTLMKLLLKFYKVSSGEITLGDTNLNDLNSEQWRKNCGVVMQNGFIFSGTIADNISLSDTQLDAEKLDRAATIANIKEFVETLPLKYSSKVGADGIGLSEGQKQRILIARAVYKNPQYLFFDEATSALDSRNELVIMNNMSKYFIGKTVFIIAHRLSTVKNADQIIVLDEGKVVEIGNHSQLSKMRGYYFNLVKNQLELGT